MKKTILLLCSLAVLCFSSCIKEDVNGKGSNANLVKVCFHATNDLADNAPETKIGLNDNATKYVWKEGDKVGIYDTGTTSFKEFSVSKVYPDGSADIEGLLTAGYEAPFIAVYPYDANATLGTHNGKEAVNIELKRDQTAVAGSIPPESIFIAKSETTDLTFKSVTGYVSFTVQSDNIKSVTLEDKAGASLVAKINVYTDGTGNAGPSDGSFFVSLTGDFQKGQTYYMAVRAGAFNSGLTLSLKDADGKVYYRTSDKKPANGAAANRLLKLGDISVDGLPLMNDSNDRKLKWIHGVDFTFGTTTVNKYTHPYLFRDDAIKNDCVCFLTKDIDMGSPYNSIIMGRYEDTKITLTKSDAPVYLPATEDENCVILSNVELNIAPGASNYLITNNKAFPLEKLILDKVSVTIPQNKHLINISNATRPIKNVTICNSDIRLSVNTTGNNLALFNVGYAVTEPVENFVFVNNVLSSPVTVDNVNNAFYIFTTNISVTTGNVIFNNNTIVNVFPKGYYMTPQIFAVDSKNEIKNNLFYFDYAIYKKVNTTDIVTGTISMLGIGNGLFSLLNSTIAQNYAIYDNIAADVAVNNDGIPNRRMKVAANINDDIIKDGIFNKTAETQNVFDLDDTAKFNIAEGIFVNKSKVYGAQR